MAKRRRKRIRWDLLTKGSADEIVVVAVAVFVFSEGLRGVEELVVGSGVVSMACEMLTI